MTADAVRRVQIALAAILSAAFALAAHAALVNRLPPAIGASLSLVPLSFLVLWVFRRTRHRVLAFAALVVAVLGCATQWALIERSFPSLFFIEHAGGNLLLAVLFGRTLAAGREPLVTTFARIAHGGLTPPLARYSRQVTVAWTALFCALFAASCALYLAGQREAWSLLANFLSPLSMAALFAVEYVVRHRVLPDLERIGILGGARAFSRHFAGARFEATR